MRPRYELIFGTVHCVGRYSYSAAVTDDPERAERWTGDRMAPADAVPKLPPGDPVHGCPVAHCHMKRQRPWRRCRPVEPSAPERSFPATSSFERSRCQTSGKDED